MTDPMSDPRLTALKAALANLRDAMADDDETADLRVAVAAAREAFDDPDPPEPEPPELLPDLATVDQALRADDPVAWLAQRAADLGATASDAEALRRVLRAGHRREPAPPALVEAATRELDRRERAACRTERLALLEDGGALHNARDQKASVAAMRALVATAMLGLPVPTGLQPVTDWHGVSLPKPIIWRTDDDEEREPDRVVSVGEVAVIASAGGLGKSTLTFGVAAAAAGAHCRGSRFGNHCGLRVAAGPVALVSLEEQEPWILRGLRWYAGDDAAGNKTLSRVYVLPHAEPLWQAAADRGGQAAPTRQWTPLWESVRAVGARLVIVDPVSATLVDVSTTETGPVRTFLRALEMMAAPDPERGWDGCGVLLVAHDTKEHRADIAAGAAPGAGSIAGSAAWWDGPRGVLTVARIPDGLRIECAKSNHGSTGWGADLKTRSDAGDFTGFDPEPLRVYTREGLEARRDAEWASRKAETAKPGNLQKAARADAAAAWERYGKLTGHSYADAWQHKAAVPVNQRAKVKPGRYSPDEL